MQAQADECRQPNCMASPFDLYICLQEGCGFVACGRTSKGHAEHHATSKEHHCAMGVKSGMMWCYTCDSEVNEAERGPSDYNVSLACCRGATRCRAVPTGLREWTSSSPPNPRT